MRSSESTLLLLLGQALALAYPAQANLDDMITANLDFRRSADGVAARVPQAYSSQPGIVLGAPGDPCGAECEDTFTARCLGHHCDDGKDGVAICTAELRAGEGPMAQLCDKGCVFTQKMREATCANQPPPPKPPKMGFGEWGAPLWTALEMYAQLYPFTADAAKQAEAEAFFRPKGILSSSIPCGKCKHHFDEYTTATPAAVGGREELVRWALALHNSVNKRVEEDTREMSSPSHRKVAVVWTEEEVYEAYHGTHWRQVMESQRFSEEAEKQELVKQAAMSPEDRARYLENIEKRRHDHDQIGDLGGGGLAEDSNYNSNVEYFKDENGEWQERPFVPDQPGLDAQSDMDIL